MAGEDDPVRCYVCGHPIQPWEHVRGGCIYCSGEKKGTQPTQHKG